MPDPTDELQVEDIGAVRRVTFNRPDRFNALPPSLFGRLASLFQAASADPSVRCLVLTGAGKAFCAGGDVGALASSAPEYAVPPEVAADALRGRMECVRLLHVMPKPTIALLNGVAAGAGMALALACDMRVACERARMTTAFAKVGLCGDYGGTYLLTRLAGPAIARELYFTSAVIDIDRMVELRLVNRRVASEELQAEGMALAQELAAGPTLAYRYMKASLNAAIHDSIENVMDAEAFGTMRTLGSLDYKEGTEAFLEKRKPLFRGL